MEKNPTFEDEIKLRPALANLVGFDRAADEMIAYGYALWGVPEWEK